MSNSLILPGTFPRVPVSAAGGLNTPSYTFQDRPINGNNTSRQPDKTLGIFAGTTVGAGPTASGHWDITGFSVSVKLGILQVVGVAGQQYWARPGNLWAGVLIDQSAPTSVGNYPPASFPADLSTFTKIWDGSTDYAGMPNGILDESGYTNIPNLYILPFPKTVQPGTQLSFALIMTPSILDPCLAITCWSCQFAVHYNPVERGH